VAATLIAGKSRRPARIRVALPTEDDICERGCLTEAIQVIITGLRPLGDLHAHGIERQSEIRIE
jgi:hypothetical protein